MFASRLIIPFIALCASLVSNNNALLTTSSSANTNLTCKEFCIISQVSDVDNAESAQQIVVKDQVLRNKKPFDDGVHQSRHKPLANEGYLRASSIIFGLTQIANEDYLSKSCFEHLKDLGIAVLQKDTWAMKVLDSSGSKPSGFLWGHNYWFGSRDGCKAVQEPVYITLSDQYERAMKKGLINDLSPYEMDYRIIYVRHNSPWQVEIKLMSEKIIHVGLCLPKSCTNDEVYNLTQTYMEWGFFEEVNQYDLNPDVIYIKDLKLKDEFFNKKSVKIVGVALMFTVVMIVLALCQNPICEEKKPNIETDCTILDKASLNESSGRIAAEHEGINDTRDRSSFHNFIKCFDLINNGRSLFSFEQASSNAIPVINGLRSVSCIWIMLFHVVWYMYFTVDNKTFLISLGERVFFQYVSTAPLLVDVFFTISGFLSAHNFIRNERNLQTIRGNSSIQNIKMFFKMVLHRYFRLAPLYLVLTGMVEIFTSYIKDVSFFHIHERYDQTCSKYWWRNILFIQNFFHHEKMCLNWTWSLACEMQFFIIATALLFVYVRYPQRVKTIVVLGIIASVFWTYFVGFQSKYRLSFDVIYHTGTQVYMNPFIRIMPYLIGVAAGWFLATSKGQFTINPIIEKCIWNVAILIFFGCIYSTVKRDMSLVSTVSLWVFGRLFFSCAVSWMIIGSATGRGVWWSRFLELTVFQHFNKLSYAIYLLNPFVIAVVFSLSNTSTHADPIMLCVITSGFVVIVYICSIVFSLSFEIPYYNLSSQLLRRKVKMA